MSIVAQDLSLIVSGQHWLYPFDLTLEPGSFTTLIGATRAGKTSLLRVLAGLSAPSSGKLYVDGKDVTGVNVRHRSVGMVYQEFVNYPGKTVFENIAAPLKNARQDTTFIRKRVEEVAELVGIAQFLKRYPLELSGGQQQRLSIARTIAQPRSLVLLDEPLVNLDYKLREHLRGQFRQLFKDSQSIVVYASSEPKEALILNGDTIVLHEGRLVQHGTANQVYSSPHSITVAGQISDPPISIVSAELSLGGRVWSIEGTQIGPEINRPAPLADGTYQLGLYPHHITTKPDGDGINTVIDFVEVSGSNSFLYLRHGNQTIAVKEQGVHDHTIGKPLKIGINLSQALVFDMSGNLSAGPLKEQTHG